VTILGQQESHKEITTKRVKISAFLLRVVDDARKDRLANVGQGQGHGPRSGTKIKDIQSHLE
jgi:hypothetical protein